MTPLALAVLAAGLDLSVAAGWAGGGPDTTYVHSYITQVDFDSTSTGTAGHTLTMPAPSGFGLQASLAIPVKSRLALEALVHVRRADVEGTTTPYMYRVEYVSRPPPDNLPRQVVSEGSQAWDPPTGERHQLVLAANLRVRVHDGGSSVLDLSAGPALHRVSGTLEGLAYTDFFLGGHSVLFSDTYRVGADLPATWMGGFDLGASAAVRLNPHVRIVLDGRWFAASEHEVQPVPARILNPDEVIRTLDPAELPQRLSLNPAAIRPSFGALTAGIRVSF